MLLLVTSKEKVGRDLSWTIRHVLKRAQRKSATQHIVRYWFAIFIFDPDRPLHAPTPSLPFRRQPTNGTMNCVVFAILALAMASAAHGKSDVEYPQQ